MDTYPRDRCGPAVAIVLVNWNGWRDVIECIDSVLSQHHEHFHIFLVDNDSNDQSIERIAAWCESPKPLEGWRTYPGVERVTTLAGQRRIPHRIVGGVSGALEPAAAGCRLTLIRSGRNGGFAAGCNVGLRAAGFERFDYFWLLNSDTVVHRDALLALLARALQDPRVGMIGSTLLYYATPQVVQAFGGGEIDSSTGAARVLGARQAVESMPQDGALVEEAMHYVYGASMLVSRAFVRDVGLMQEDYFLYYEEADWALRARGRFSLGYAPSSIILHKAGASSAKVMPLFSMRHYYRNRIRFVCRFYPQHVATARRALIWEGMRYLLRGRLAKARVVFEIVSETAQLYRQLHLGSRQIGGTQGELGR